MRILAISNTYPPHYFGGYELTCADVMRRFVQRGHDVMVLTSTVRVDGAGDEDPTVPVRRELSVAWDWSANSPRLPRWPVRRWQAARNDLRALAAAVRDHRPEVVSVWHFGALSMPLLVALEDARLPMVVTVANDWLVHAETLDPWMRLWRWLPSSWRPVIGGVPTRRPGMDAARFNFVSAHTRDRAATATAYDVSDATIVPPGIDTDDFPLTAPAAPPWQWRLLYVGRVTADKGVATAVRALPLLPAAATLDVVGEGEPAYVQSLQHLAAELHVADRVRFTQCPRSQLAARYAAADVVVFPSEWDEPFGLVPIEAMACSRPVVATGTGGSADFLRHEGNCLLFPPGHARALAARIQRLADDPALRLALVSSGARTAAALTADAYAEALLDLHVAAVQQLRAPVGSPRRKEDRR